MSATSRVFFLFWSSFFWYLLLGKWLKLETICRPTWFLTFSSDWRLSPFFFLFFILHGWSLLSYRWFHRLHRLRRLHRFHITDFFLLNWLLVVNLTLLVVVCQLCHLGKSLLHIVSPCCSDHKMRSSLPPINPITVNFRGIYALLVSQVALVAQDDKRHVVFSFYLPKLFLPLSQMFAWLLLCDVIHQYATMSISIKGGTETLETFLACRVPHLEANDEPIF